MATTLRRAHHSRRLPIYPSVADIGQEYSALTSALHGNTKQNASDYSELRHVDAPHHVDHEALIAQAQPDQHHDYGNEDEGPVIAGGPEDTVMMDRHDDFDMLPPSPSTHPSWQALHDYAQSHAAQNGYALSINTTAKNRSRIKLACVCYGQPKNTHKLTAETRVRKNRVSSKTGCKMWIEGKKQSDGTWMLRVGEAQHNHPGRPSEGWAVQRKRTWGVVGGRIGVGGVTAKEELAKMASSGNLAADIDEEDEGEDTTMGVAEEQPSHSHERGGLVWKLVEQEMLRKGEPNSGRDRGVGRTVEVLQAQLPGIHIFKRDVYNIRAQIKRARRVADGQLEDCIRDPDNVRPTPSKRVQQEDIVVTEDDDNNTETTSPNISLQPNQRPVAPFHEAGQAASLTSHQALSASEAEIARLRKENAQLKLLLAERTKTLKERTIEIASLRAEADFARNMAMLPSGRAQNHEKDLANTLCLH